MGEIEKRKCDYCGQTFQPIRRTQRFCPGKPCRVYAWRDKERTIPGAQTKHLRALVEADVPPTQLLKVAGIKLKDIAAAAGLSYPHTRQLASKPISWKNQAPGTRSLRRAIMEALDMPDIWDLD